MRAVVLRDDQLILEDIEEPVPGPDQMLVRTLFNGICGSDLHAVEFAKYAPERPVPTVLGHEFCAEVVDYAPSSEDRPFAIGSKITANPFSPGRFINPGGLAEFMAVDVTRALAVPAELPAEKAALTEPLAVGIRTVAVGDTLPGGSPYVVNGCGPVGLAVILALRAIGRGPILAADPAPIRRKVAQKLGVDLAIDPSEDSIFQHLGEFGFRRAYRSPLLPPGTSGPLGPTIYECSGANGMLARLLDAVPQHSVIVVAGIPTQPDAFHATAAVSKELTIGYAMAYRHEELELALCRIASGAVDTDLLITATVPLAETPWAFEALRRAEHVKILIDPRR